MVSDEMIIILILRRKLRLKSMTNYNFPNGWVSIWNSSLTENPISDY